MQVGGSVDFVGFFGVLQSFSSPTPSLPVCCAHTDTHAHLLVVEIRFPRPAFAVCKRTDVPFFDVWKIVARDRARSCGYFDDFEIIVKGYFFPVSKTTTTTTTIAGVCVCFGSSVAHQRASVLVPCRP